MDKKIDLAKELTNKSIEAFLLAIEIFNKPTIQYRVEGFGFFICNAWELMLKAYLIKIKGENSIYYKDKPDRSISLESCLRQIMTNENDPIRKNLEKIIELRNTSTHFILKEYEELYVPLFQASVINYSNKIKEYLNEDIGEHIPYGFLTLMPKFEAGVGERIKASYPQVISEKYESLKKKLNSEYSKGNDKFAIPVEHYFYITKNKNSATDTICLDKTSKNNGILVKELQDPNKDFPYTTTSLIKAINERLKREKVTLFYKGEAKNFTNRDFTNFPKYFSLKKNKEFCYIDMHRKQRLYFYSLKAYQYIIDTLKRNSRDILDTVAAKRITPGAKEFSA